MEVSVLLGTFCAELCWWVATGCWKRVASFGDSQLHMKYLTRTTTNIILFSPSSLSEARALTTDPASKINRLQATTMMIKMFKAAYNWVMQKKRALNATDSFCSEGGKSVSPSWDIIAGPVGITDHKFIGCNDPLFYRKGDNATRCHTVCPVSKLGSWVSSMDVDLLIFLCSFALHSVA